MTPRIFTVGTWQFRAFVAVVLVFALLAVASFICSYFRDYWGDE